jgi:hypothetical protein
VINQDTSQRYTNQRPNQRNSKLHQDIRDPIQSIPCTPNQGTESIKRNPNSQPQQLTPNRSKAKLIRSTTANPSGEIGVLITETSEFPTQITRAKIKHQIDTNPDLICLGRPKIVQIGAVDDGEGGSEGLTGKTKGSQQADWEDRGGGGERRRLVNGGEVRFVWVGDRVAGEGLL